MLDIIITLAEAFRTQRKQLYMVGGTVRDVLLHYGSDIIEITTFRDEKYNPESRKPEVCFGTVLEEDLRRRDFTINAMARDPLNGDIIDPFKGRQDLEAYILRAVGNEPDKRFDEDPLRLMRAVRFAAQLDFSIEPETMRSIARQAPKLQKISRERIRDEMNKLLLSAHPAKGLDLLVELGLMEWIVPEVLELRGVSQQPQRGVRSKDVYAHVLRVIERSSPRQIAREILKGLHFDRDFIESVSRLVRLHMRANDYTPDWTDGAVRRLMLESGENLPDLLDLSRADITSYRADKVTRAAARVAELAERCQRLKEEAERVPLKSPLNGDELMRLFGRGPGPWLRPIKDHLLGLVIDGVLSPDDKEEAARIARALVAQEDIG